MEATPVVIPRPWGLGRPFPVNIATNEWCEPTLLKLDPVPVDYSAWSAPFGIVHKTPDRAVYEAAAARVASPDALLHSRAGHVLESCIANIAVHDRAAGVWITPGADPALGEWLLPGCYRAHAIEHGWIREGSVAVESVLAPDALVLAFNSVRGWWPVRVVVSSS
ncbi:hypothetical protein BC828DRAFT_382785 [Blastocladiella britannica]|nr:hypothetical protein BC828DRAFT_382785 [Blastocladiella britannica]